MPSDKTDERALAALEAMARPREAFHSAMVATLEQVRGVLAARAVSAEQRAVRTTAELGAFAAGRIDVARFDRLTETHTSLDEGSAAHIERAVRTLESLIERGEDLYRARVEPGSDLKETVERSLGEAGRAFGAARTAELARGGRYRTEDHESWADCFPPGRWSHRERSLAPPLVVEVQGEDLQVGGLAEFMDGSQKIVLVVSGKAPPAALVRLITPSVFVMQADDHGSIHRLAEVAGPAVAALIPPGSSRFTHYPAADGRPSRLSVEHVPDEEPKRALGAVSAFQQSEELRQLMAMGGYAPGWSAPMGEAATETAAGSAAGSAAPSRAPAESGPADRLAAWILRQADLSGLD